MKLRRLRILFVCVGLFVCTTAAGQDVGEEDSPQADPDQTESIEITTDDKTGSELLREAEKTLADVDLAKVGLLASAAIEKGDLALRDAARAYELRAIGEVFAGNSDTAIATYTVVLSIDADYQLDASLGPDFAEPYRVAKARLAVYSRPFTLGVSEEPVEGAPPKVVISLEDPAQVASRTQVRMSDKESPWIELKKARSTTVTFEELGLKEEAVPTRKTLGVIAEALDAYGNVLARSGTPENGVVVFENAGYVPPSSTVFESPWFWIIAGVVVAGGVTGAIILGTAEPQYNGAIQTTFGGT